MKNYSQTFVQYHSCGNSYLDGTNMLIETGRRCATPTYNPFWKRPIDSNNKIAKSTRNKLKIKSRAIRSYMLNYAKFVKNYHKNEYYDPYFIDNNESSDTDSEISDNSSNDSTASNAIETEQNLTDTELNKPETEENSMNLNTGDTLIIVINEQNSNNKEINNKIVPSDI